MGMLGDFLEAVYGPTDRFQTVRAVIRQREDRAAVARALGSVEPPTGRRKPDLGSRQAELRVWLASPDRARIEETRYRNGGVESRLIVAGGGWWWERDHQGNVEVVEPGGRPSRASPDLTDVKRHFIPSALREYFVALRLEPLGTVRTAGRDCLRVRAVRRPGGRLWPHWLGSGDEYEFHADPERGALLFVASRCRGEVLTTNEVTEVAFDEPLADELFTYEPRPGEQVRPANRLSEPLTLAAAVARMPFTVLVPTRVPEPERARSRVMFHPARVNVPRASLSMTYGGGYPLVINQSEAPAPLDEYEWEPVERDGRRLEISDPGPGPGKRLVRLEHLGTHVDICSDLDRERLIDVAASLAPASQANAD